jgi:hypothetical protein
MEFGDSGVCVLHHTSQQTSIRKRFAHLVRACQDGFAARFSENFFFAKSGIGKTCAGKTSQPIGPLIQYETLRSRFDKTPSCRWSSSFS